MGWISPSAEGLSVQPWPNSSSTVPRDGSLGTGQLPTAPATRRALSHTPWPEQSHESLSFVLGQIPKAGQTQPHTFTALPGTPEKPLFLLLSNPSNPKRSCSQQQSFPAEILSSRNPSLSQLFSFFVSLKCQWWQKNNEALRGEIFPCNGNCRQSTSCLPQHRKKLGVMWAAGGNNKHKTQWISTKTQHNFIWRNRQTFKRQLINQKINMKFYTQRKNSPGTPALSGFTQPVWRGSKITGNISIKVAIWVAVGKRKMLVCAAVCRRNNAKDHHSSTKPCHSHSLCPALNPSTSVWKSTRKREKNIGKTTWVVRGNKLFPCDRR